MRAAACSSWPSLASGLSSASLRRSRASVGVVESILKAALFVLVASTGEKLAARRTGRGATSTRLSSGALKLMSKRARDGRYLRVTSWVDNGGSGLEEREAMCHVTRPREFDGWSLHLSSCCRRLTSFRRTLMIDPCLGPSDTKT